MPAAELAVFHRSLQRIDRTRSRMESLHTKGSVTKTDLEYVYEALFLRAVTSFESYLEQLFISILLGRSNYPRGKIRVLMQARSRNSLLAILKQNDNYLDWLPYRKTEDRARLYIKDGCPFSEMSSANKSLVMEIVHTRNAIAHKSDHALRTFQGKVIGSRLLLRNEKTPAGFLRSPSRASPRQLRFEIYLAELGRIAATLSW